MLARIIVALCGLHTVANEIDFTLTLLELIVHTRANWKVRNMKGAEMTPWRRAQTLSDLPANVKRASMDDTN
jgi:hypothetical protein